jgi:hypothetical protein
VFVVGTGLLEESLKVVYWRSSVALDAVSGCCDGLHVEVVHLIVVIIIAVSHDSGPLRVPPPPLLTAHDVLHGALDDDAGWHCLATVEDHFPTA